jgi:hypothetical protein
MLFKNKHAIFVILIIFKNKKFYTRGDEFIEKTER